MEKRYLLGIDAGGTKTAYALYDIQEDRTLLLFGGSGNHECLEGGYEELHEVMASHIGRLCGAAGIDPEQIGGAGLGIAGVDTRRQHRIISEIFRKIGLTDFALGNDAVLGIKAECPAGICTVNGTGFSVYGIDDLGNTAQLGGFGSMSGDRGGGDYFAENAIEAVYRALEKEGPKTAMTGKLLQMLQVEDSDLFMEKISEKREGTDQGEFRKQVSIMLHQCAAEGDEAASEILRESGREYATCVRGVLRHLPRLTESGTVELILVGSGFLKSSCDLVRRSMEEELKRKLPGLVFNIRPIRTDPVAGGLLWAREKAGPAGEKIPGDRIRASFLKAEILPGR